MANRRRNDPQPPAPDPLTGSQVGMLAQGAAVIARHLADMPPGPGVYRMLDAKGDPLYVGKAKSLRARVASYTRPAGSSARIQRMIAQTAAMEIVTTGSEAEALLLEANLIKRLAPRYNILLRDDKSFPYILLSGDHPYPRIGKHRGALAKGTHYFGPFASVGAVNETIALLQRGFLLRPCSDTVFKGRTRPCLQYQIKRCSAPCVGYIGEDEYGGLVKQANDFLSGKSRAVQDALLVQMQEASAAQDYERAAMLRDRIAALTRVQQEQAIHATSISDADVVALFREGGQCCIQVFFFRGGQNFGNRSYFPRHDAESSDSDILCAFLAQFYQSRPCPREILLSHEIGEEAVLKDALALLWQVRPNFLVPQRGEKKTLIDRALEQAKMALSRQRADVASQAELLAGVAKLFALDAPPERIEVYDNSHIMGAHAVGAMIVAGAEGFLKKHYRRFNPKTEDLAPGDDYGLLREVLTRRFGRLAADDPDRTGGQWPDLVLIDGGAGQLSVALQVMADLGISDVPLVGIAKGPDRHAGREQFFLPERTPFQLPPDDPVLHYLQRLRDEAHRFAIGSHRDKRSRTIVRSELDAIPGIGAARKRALLHHFGSAKGVGLASLVELEKVEGISRKTAELIFQHFHGG